MVSFVPRGHQINAIRNQTRIKRIQNQRLNQLLISEFTIMEMEMLEIFAYHTVVHFTDQN